MIDLHEGILGEFAERACKRSRPDRYLIVQDKRRALRPAEADGGAADRHRYATDAEYRAVKIESAGARQKALRSDPVLGDAYRAKLAAARRAYRARKAAT